MKRLVTLTLLASAALTPAAGRWPYPGLGVESPLKLTDIIARPKYGSLTISPDGKFFAGVAITGVRHAIASRMGSPNPSRRLPNSHMSHAL